MVLAVFVDAFLEAGTAAATTTTGVLMTLGVTLAGLAGVTLVFLEIAILEGVFAMAFLRREEVETLGVVIAFLG
jgi:hypothetical protein